MADTTTPIEFIWKGKDRSGNVTTGEISAKSEILARTDLRRRGIRVISIRKKPKPLFVSKSTIKPKDIALFSRQLATMLEAGVPVVQAFDIIGKGHENPAMMELLIGIKNDIESGDNLSEALAKHPLYFDELFCNLVAAGEKAGILETLLDKIATYKEKTESLKAKIKKALTYPTAVIVVAFIVTAILLIFVVPVFEELFESFGAELPAFTQFVIGISQWMQEYWWILLGTILGFFYLFRYIKKRSRAFNHFLDRVLLKIPVIGAILHKAAIARFARTLSTMFAAGVPLIEALASVAGASGNIVYEDITLKIREDVATGQQLQFAMQQSKIFPHMVVQMVAIGEESGSIDSMLGKVADFYEEEVDNAVDNLSSLLEPLIMSILGILVGGLIVAMYLPIFKLGAAI